MLGLRTTIYKVEDLNKAKEWYSNAFMTKPYFDEPFYIGFNIGGYELGLLPDNTPAESKVEGVLSFRGVDNIMETYNRLLSLGATKNEEPTDVGDNIMTATVKDPFGNIIGLIYNPHFKIQG